MTRAVQKVDHNGRVVEFTLNPEGDVCRRYPHLPHSRPWPADRLTAGTCGTTLAALYEELTQQEGGA